MAVALSVLVNDVLPEVLGCPYPLIETRVKDVLADFCEGTDAYNSGFRKNVLATDPTTPNRQITVAVPAAFAEWKPSDILGLRIDGVPYDTKRRVIIDDLTNIADIEENRVKFWYPATAASIIMYPFNAVAVQVYLQVAFKPLTTVTSVEDTFYQEWRDAIASGVKARLMVMPRKPWTNAQLSSHYQDRYDDAKSSAIISVMNNRDREGDRRTNGFM